MCFLHTYCRHVIDTTFKTRNPTLVYSHVATGDLLMLSGQFPTPTPRSGAGQAQSVTK